MNRYLQPPIEGQIYQRVLHLDAYDAHNGREDTLDINEAQVITSRMKSYGMPISEYFDITEPRHKVLLDIDVPAQLVPSSTPGHSHLYIDKELTERQWRVLIEALDYAGIIEPGYANASLQRGYTALRLPWVRKDRKVVKPSDSFF